MNFYQLQNLAPAFFALGLYFDFKFVFLFLVACFAGCRYFVSFGFLHPILVRISFFFLFGALRQYFVHYDQNYSLRYTSFEASVIDYRIKEDRAYLLLSNFVYYPLQSTFYSLDISPIFPSFALMRVDDIEGFKYASKIRGIGRFFLPLPSIGSARTNKTVQGVLKTSTVLEFSKGSFKHYLREKFKLLHPQAYSLACAMFLSDTFAVSKEQRAAFERAGLAHLLGVSILNLGVLLFFFFYCFYWFLAFVFPRSSFILPFNVTARLLSLLLVLVYCFLIGFEFPLLRALIMAGFALLSSFSGRINQLESLFLAAVLVLFFDPSAIFDLSFQLSFAGVWGIFAWSFIYSSNLFLSSLWTTFSAVSLIIPLSIFHFQKVALQPFLANLLVTPLLSFSFIPSLTLFAFLPYFLAKYLVFFINWQLFFLENLVLFLSKLALNTRFLPVFYTFFIAFLVCFYLFSIFKESFRYVFLALAYFSFSVGLLQSYFLPPFILVDSSSVGLVLKDRILAYPKVSYACQAWGEFYNLPVIDGANSGVFINDSNKIIVHEIGIVRGSLAGKYSIITKKDYVFTPTDLMNQTQIIYLEK